MFRIAQLKDTGIRKQHRLLLQDNMFFNIRTYSVSGTNVILGLDFPVKLNDDGSYLDALGHSANDGTSNNLRVRKMSRWIFNMNC